MPQHGLDRLTHDLLANSGSMRMASFTVLFVPWSRALGTTVDEFTVFASDLRLDAAGRVALTHPDWPLSNASVEYSNLKNRRWMDYVNAKPNGLPAPRVVEVFYTGKMNTILMGIQQDADIYIRGHGIANTDYICSPPTENRLYATEVALRLWESGLRLDFTGQIKCYNCHSAEDGPTAFAQVFANALYGLGYQTCTYWGYFGALDSCPRESHAEHKYSSYSTPERRCSEERIQIHPDPISTPWPWAQGMTPAVPRVWL